MKTIFASFLAVFTCAAIAQGQPAGSQAEPAKPMEFEQFQLVLLQRPANAPDYPREKLAEIQHAHLAHLRKLAESGVLLVAGPFSDQPDPKVRGMSLMRAGSIEEARRLAEADPAVMAGRLEVVISTWHVQKGAMTFPVAMEMQKK